MPVTKVKSKWSSGNLIFHEDPNNRGGQIIFGEDGDGLDVKFRGDTSGAYMLWDESADKLLFDKADVQLGDSDELRFGDLAAGDVVVTFDGTNFKITPAAASQAALFGGDSNLLNITHKGTLTVGKDDTGHDVKFFGATAGNYFLWDESANKLIILGTADLGSSCEADAYSVGGTAGADFDGAVTNITVVKGIVTAAS